MTYSQLQEQVARFAGGLASLGVRAGDRVVIYMPMVPEAVTAMLACARIGAIHSVVFGGFAPNELASRLSDAAPKVIVTSTCGIEISKVLEYMPIVNEAIGLSEKKPDHVVVLERPQAEFEPTIDRDITWSELMETAQPADCVPVNATHPLYILYTSGTTGKPKGVVRDNGGHAVAMCYSMSAVYDMSPGEVFWAASDVGWVVGHSYIVYAPLLFGCSTVLYEGKPVKTPDAGHFGGLLRNIRSKFYSLHRLPFALFVKRILSVNTIKITSLARLRPFTWRVNDLIHQPITGYMNFLVFLLSIIGGKQKQGGQSPLTQEDWSRSSRKRVLQRCQPQVSRSRSWTRMVNKHLPENRAVWL